METGMIPFIGRGLSMALAFRRYPAAWGADEESVPAIEQALENAEMLLTQMRARKEHWQGEIAFATEELRQTEAIISATTAMRDKLVTELMPPGVRTDVLDYASDDFDRVVAAIITDGESAAQSA